MATLTAMCRATKHCPRLPREVVGVLFLEILRVKGLGSEHLVEM